MRCSCSLWAGFKLPAVSGGNTKRSLFISKCTQFCFLRILLADHMYGPSASLPRKNRRSAVKLYPRSLHGLLIGVLQTYWLQMRRWEFSCTGRKAISRVLCENHTLCWHVYTVSVSDNTISVKRYSNPHSQAATFASIIVFSFVEYYAMPIITELRRLTVCSLFRNKPLQ